MPDVQQNAPLRLNLGCGSVQPEGWLNVDASLGARLAKLPWLGPWLARSAGLRIRWSPRIRIHDLRRPLPWADASAEVVYSSHTLEHLSREDGARFLQECVRVLAPGGVLRVVVPDVAGIVDDYRQGKLEAPALLDALGTGYEEPGDAPWKRRLAPLFRHPHRCMYDAESLVAAFARAGLPEAGVHPPELSRIPNLSDVELFARTEGSVIVEASRPG